MTLQMQITADYNGNDMSSYFSNDGTKLFYDFTDLGVNDYSSFFAFAVTVQVTFSYVENPAIEMIASDLVIAVRNCENFANNNELLGTIEASWLGYVYIELGNS